MERAVTGCDDRRLVRPGLEETPLLPEQRVDQLRIKRTEAAEQHEQVVASDDRGGIELQTAERDNEVMDAVSRHG